MGGHPYKGRAERLHAPERLARLEVARVVRLAGEGLTLGSVLDIGTGTGIFAEAFSLLGLKVSGIDSNAGLPEVARARLPGLEFLEGVAEKLPFSGGSFDLVFLGHLLHEAETPLSVLTEARRVAARRVVVLEWPYRADDLGPPLEHRLRPETVLALADTAGFLGGERLTLEHMDLYRLRAGG